MPFSRSMRSATSRPVSPPGNGMREYFLNLLCKRADTNQLRPAMPMKMIQ